MEDFLKLIESDSADMKKRMNNQIINLDSSNNTTPPLYKSKSTNNDNNEDDYGEEQKYNYEYRNSKYGNDKKRKENNEEQKQNSKYKKSEHEEYKYENNRCTEQTFIDNDECIAYMSTWSIQYSELTMLYHQFVQFDNNIILKTNDILTTSNIYKIKRKIEYTKYTNETIGLYGGSGYDNHVNHFYGF